MNNVPQATAPIQGTDPAASEAVSSELSTKTGVNQFREWRAREELGISPLWLSYAEERVSEGDFLAAYNAMRHYGAGLGESLRDYGNEQWLVRYGAVQLRIEEGRTYERTHGIGSLLNGREVFPRAWIRPPMNPRPRWHAWEPESWFLPNPCPSLRPLDPNEVVYFGLDT